MRSKYLKLLFALVAVVCAATAHGKVYLVSIGISDYPGRANDLRLPANDASTIKWLYDENSSSETKLLLNSQATVARVKQSMEIFTKAKPNDIVVLFFSGHGVPGGFICYDNVLEYKYIRDAFARCASKNKMIFADACYAGAMRNDKSVANYGTLKGANIMLFLSCRSGESSIENYRYSNGFFTYALQHGLRGGADADRNRTITAHELFNYVSAKVKKMSQNKQHPVMWGKFSNSMPVMKW